MVLCDSHLLPLHVKNELQVVNAQVFANVSIVVVISVFPLCLLSVAGIFMHQSEFSII